ncbi:MAG: hypothetical protein EZS28_011876 [Streblomastix strix]|uniref:Uncharacterized protein n=1 Tax=Streblomastix strix TaxID=222440 RepID=A0A5J4WDT0_9EUKA|nr:MAG: hypothetical protein EZS28_011876 [Streblomastix strix]
MGESLKRIIHPRITKRNDSGTQLLATVNGEANPDINITKISANTLFHNENGSDGLGGNGCVTQIKVATNENGYSNHQIFDNTGNENNNEQTNDNRIGGNENKQGSDSENQYEQKINLQNNGNTKYKGSGSLHTTHSEQELGNPNISQPKIQLPLITTHPELGQKQNRLAKVRTQQALRDSRSQSQLKLSQPIHTPVGAQKKGRFRLQVTEDKSINRSKGNMTSAGSKKQNKEPTPRIRQRQFPILRLTCRNSWIDQGRKKERRKGRNLGSYETDKENREISDRNGRINSEILGYI